MALTRTETELSGVALDAFAPTNVDLSVVIPLYNEEESIDSAVQEVLDVLRMLPLQFELILVNDGSTDSTGA
jgi:glycosyltransferase involved in cell wall biosynthesis